MYNGGGCGSFKRKSIILKKYCFFIFKNDDVSYLWLILYYTLTLYKIEISYHGVNITILYMGVPTVFQLCSKSV